MRGFSDTGIGTPDAEMKFVVLRHFMVQLSCILRYLYLFIRYYSIIPFFLKFRLQKQQFATRKFSNFGDQNIEAHSLT
jgi:hypothetical protein